MAITFEKWKAIHPDGVIIKDDHPGLGGVLKLSGKESLQVRDELLRRYPLGIDQIGPMLEKLGVMYVTVLSNERGGVGNVENMHGLSVAYAKPSAGSREPSLKAAPLSLAVGKWYKRRDGETVQITGKTSYPEYPLGDSSGLYYTMDGRFHIGRLNHSLDLLEEVPAPALKLEVGKWYRRRDGKKVKIERAIVGDGGFLCSNGMAVTSKGEFAPLNSDGSLDLIAETTAPDEEKKALADGGHGVCVGGGLGNGYIRFEMGSSAIGGSFSSGAIRHEGRWGGDVSSSKPPAPLSVGDLVRLKSGGPVMTVVYVGRGVEADCQWFNEGVGAVSTGTFKHAALVRAKPDDGSVSGRVVFS